MPIKPNNSKYGFMLEADGKVSFRGLTYSRATGFSQFPTDAKGCVAEKLPGKNQPMLFVGRHGTIERAYKFRGGRWRFVSPASIQPHVPERSIKKEFIAIILAIWRLVKFWWWRGGEARWSSLTSKQLQVHDFLRLNPDGTFDCKMATKGCC